MFQSTPANLPYYLRFIERYSSLAYAMAFSETGDFFEAQNIVERAFAEGYPLWAGRFPRNRDTEDTLQKILKRQLPAAGSAPKREPLATFSKSKKLQDVQEAQSLLLGFSGLNRIALFLEVVEEMPRDRVARLLGRPQEFFEEVHEQLDAAVRKWRPDDAEAMEVFTRTLRQYRLPPSLLTNIESKMDFSWKRSFNATSIVRNGLIAIGVVVVIIGVSGDRRVNPFRSAQAYQPYDPYTMQVARQQVVVRDGLGAFPSGASNMLLWLDLIMVAAIMALKRGLERHEGEGLALSGEFEHPLTSLPVLHTFGTILVTAGVVNFVVPSTFQESWVPTAYVATHALFLPLAAAGIMRVMVRIMLHREGRA